MPLEFDERLVQSLLNNTSAPSVESGLAQIILPHYRVHSGPKDTREAAANDRRRAAIYVENLATPIFAQTDTAEEVERKFEQLLEETLELAPSSPFFDFILRYCCTAEQLGLAELMPITLMKMATSTKDDIQLVSCGSNRQKRCYLQKLPQGKILYTVIGFFHKVRQEDTAGSISLIELDREIIQKISYCLYKNCRARNIIEVEPIENVILVHRESIAYPGLLQAQQAGLSQLEYYTSIFWDAFNAAIVRQEKRLIPPQDHQQFFVGLSDSDGIFVEGFSTQLQQYLSNPSGYQSQQMGALKFRTSYVNQRQVLEIERKQQLNGDINIYLQSMKADAQGEFELRPAVQIAATVFYQTLSSGIVPHFGFLTFSPEEGERQQFLIVEKVRGHSFPGRRLPYHYSLVVLIQLMLGVNQVFPEDCLFDQGKIIILNHRDILDEKEQFFLNFLFCLPEAMQALDAGAVSYILSLDPLKLVQKYIVKLRERINQYDRFMHPETLFSPGQITALVDRIQRIQAFLRQDPQITPIALLKIFRADGDAYQEIFNSFSYYGFQKKWAAIKALAAKTERPKSCAKTPSLSYQDSLDQAEKELEWIAKLPQLDKCINLLLSPQQEQEVAYLAEQSVSFRYYILENFPWDTLKRPEQQELLEAMLKKNIFQGLNNLTLKNISALTDKLMHKILRQTTDCLESLTLDGCFSVGAELCKHLTEYAPNLVFLSLLASCNFDPIDRITAPEEGQCYQLPLRLTSPTLQMLHLECVHVQDKMELALPELSSFQFHQSTVTALDIETPKLLNPPWGDMVSLHTVRVRSAYVWGKLVSDLSFDAEDTIEVMAFLQIQYEDMKAALHDGFHRIADFYSAQGTKERNELALPLFVGEPISVVRQEDEKVLLRYYRPDPLREERCNIESIKYCIRDLKPTDRWRDVVGDHFCLFDRIAQYRNRYYGHYGKRIFSNNTPYQLKILPGHEAKIVNLKLLGSQHTSECVPALDQLTLELADIQIVEGMTGRPPSGFNEYGYPYTLDTLAITLVDPRLQDVISPAWREYVRIYLDKCYHWYGRQYTQGYGETPFSIHCGENFGVARIQDDDVYLGEEKLKFHPDDRKVFGKPTALAYVDVNLGNERTPGWHHERPACHHYCLPPWLLIGFSHGRLIVYQLSKTVYQFYTSFFMFGPDDPIMLAPEQRDEHDRNAIRRVMISQNREAVVFYHQQLPRRVSLSALCAFTSYFVQFRLYFQHDVRPHDFRCQLAPSYGRALGSANSIILLAPRAIYNSIIDIALLQLCGSQRQPKPDDNIYDHALGWSEYLPSYKYNFDTDSQVASQIVSLNMEGISIYQSRCKLLCRLISANLQNLFILNLKGVDISEEDFQKTVLLVATAKQIHLLLNSPLTTFIRDMIPPPMQLIEQTADGSEVWKSIKSRTVDAKPPLHHLMLLTQNRRSARFAADAVPQVQSLRY